MSKDEKKEIVGEKVSHIGHIYEFVEPTLEDIRLAAIIPANECPRRYCWWWMSLSFEWNILPVDGCRWLQSAKPTHWKYLDVPCCRCDSQSSIDHFEAREPHIESDGVDATQWLKSSARNKEQFPG